MFDDPDSELVDLDEKPRRSLIPDPTGEELNKLAKAKGLTSVSSLFFSVESFVNLYYLVL